MEITESAPQTSEAANQPRAKTNQGHRKQLDLPRRDEARESSVGARVVLCRDELIRGAEGVADVVDHGGYQGAAHNAAGDEGGAQPAAGDACGCHQEWSGRSPLSEALTEARNCPSKATSRSWSSMSPPMRM